MHATVIPSQPVRQMFFAKKYFLNQKNVLKSVTKGSTFSRAAAPCKAGQPGEKKGEHTAGNSF